MKITAHSYGDVKVLALKGDLTTGEGDVKLRDTLKEEVGAGFKKIIINLGGVGFMDSGGLGELMAGFTSCKKAGASVCLASLTKKTHDLLQITQLITLFDVYEDDKEAIASFVK